jgi:hypothetical protein
MMPFMQQTPTPTSMNSVPTLVKPSVTKLILEQLGHGEMRVLSLTVAIRKGMVGSAHFKGDLSATVKSALRALVAAKVVQDTEGVYSLRSIK